MQIFIYLQLESDWIKMVTIPVQVSRLFLQRSRIPSSTPVQSVEWPDLYVCESFGGSVDGEPSHVQLDKGSGFTFIVFFFPIPLNDQLVVFIYANWGKISNEKVSGKQSP